MGAKMVMEKEVFNVNDIMIICQCGKNLAYKIIREIKSVSDRLNLSGRVHRKDYEDYLERKNKREVC